MSDIDVKSYIDQLRQVLPYVPPIPVQKIKALHKKRDFAGIVQFIRNTMNVDVRLTVHWTSAPPPKGLKNAKAWMSLPEKMPYYGTPAFKELKLDIFILKSFLETSTYDAFAIVVAHELSHVVLESIEHPLRKEEKAVDLTAMLLGFSYLYRIAAHTKRAVSYIRSLGGVTVNYQTSQLGYLSRHEMDIAAKILVPSRLRTERALLNHARDNIGALLYLGVCLFVSICVLILRYIPHHWQ